MLKRPGPRVDAANRAGDGNEWLMIIKIRPRLRPPRVESWRARREGLEGAGKGGLILMIIN